MRSTYLILFLILISCNAAVKKEKVEEKQVKNKEKKEFSNLEEKLLFDIKSSLSIPETEKFGHALYKEHLNDDGVEDAIVTVNRLEFAMEEASKATNPAKRAELGYLGAYNYFFYYDGKSKQISVPIVLSSSAKAPLEVFFESIQSEDYKDLIVQYKIRNGAFRNYYLLTKDQLDIVFQWQVYDQLGEHNYTASHFSYGEGTFCLVKDIIIHVGKIKNYNTAVSDVYSYRPTIEKTNELSYRFFFDPAKSKYVTNAKPKNEL